MNSTPNFQDLTERFFQVHACRLKSYRDYQGYFLSLTEFFGMMPVRDITGQTISEYAEWRAKQVSLSSTNRCLAVLNKSLHLAWEWGWIDRLPKVRLFPEPPGRTQWLKFEDEEELLLKCPAWLRDVVVFALYTGLRLGEIINLEWSHVDLKRGILMVMKSKNGTSRTLPIHPKVREILEKKSRATKFVFPNSKGEKSRRYWISRRFRKVVGKATDFKFHDLRHSFASRLAINDVSLLKIQRLMGHKTPTMTSRYSHLMVESLEDAIRKLDER